MRGALKNPASNLGAKIHKLHPGSNPMREVRASTTHKHSQVRRFGAPAPRPAHNSHANQHVVHAQVTPRAQSKPSAQTQASSSANTMPSMVTSASHHKLERLLDVALNQADAHKQAMKYDAAKHFWQKPGFLGRGARLKVAVCAVILLLLISFAAWRTIPAFSVKLAGARAHINASVPTYIPTGYAQAAPASSQNHAVVIKYKSDTNDSATYEIAQKQSNMTSTSVAQSVVPSGTQVQTSQVGGNTVYIYGDQNHAVWVNNGVMYQIKDNADLSSDEILNIVQGINN